jgi:hypothetical protein
VAVGNFFYSLKRVRRLAPEGVQDVLGEIPCGSRLFNLKGSSIGTCVFYIDEAGDTFKHKLPITTGATPMFTLAALALPLWEWRARDRECLGLKKQFFSDLIGMSEYRPEEWEAKGSDLIKPHNADSKRRQAFLFRVLEYLRQHSATLFCVTYIKDCNDPMAPRSMYTEALHILVERFSIYITEHPSYSNGLLICDARMKGLDFNVARSHMSYIFGNETGKRFINIVEAPLFAESKLTTGLQMVDIIASLLYANHYRKYLHNTAGALNYEHAKKYWNLLEQMQFKSYKEIEGHTLNGYRIRDLRQPETLFPLERAGD